MKCVTDQGEKSHNYLCDNKDHFQFCLLVIMQQRHINCEQLLAHDTAAIFHNNKPSAPPVNHYQPQLNHFPGLTRWMRLADSFTLHLTLRYSQCSPLSLISWGFKCSVQCLQYITDMNWKYWCSQKVLFFLFYELYLNYIESTQTSNTLPWPTIGLGQIAKLQTGELCAVHIDGMCNFYGN